MDANIRPRSISRFLAHVLLAYVLVLNGLLGTLASGAHVAEARTAAQLGVICTINGMVDPHGGKTGSEDPAPGKLPCVEHCIISLANMVPAMVPDGILQGAPVPDIALSSVVARYSQPSMTSEGTPPPSRGPPFLI